MPSVAVHLMSGSAGAAPGQSPPAAGLSFSGNHRDCPAGADISLGWHNGASEYPRCSSNT
jgi:hypothetical protein